MYEEIYLEEVPTSPVPTDATSETTETVGLTEEAFNLRMDSVEYVLIGCLFCTALIAGAVIASLVMRFFHVR